MAKSAQQLLREGKDWREVGNPQLKQQLRRLQQQNYRQQLAQVNANFQAGLDQGLTAGDAATTWVLPTANQQYTVKDGDNLSTIAKNTNTTPDAILSANPDMRTPQTGMVLNTPAFQPPTATGGGGAGQMQQPKTTPVPLPGSEAWRATNIGGLPSNAALGATTTNPQGFNRYAAATNSQLQAYGAGVGAAQNRLTQPQTWIQKAAGMAGPGLSLPSSPYAGSIAKTAMAISGNYGLLEPPTATSPVGQTTSPFANGLPNAAGISRQALSASALRLLDKVNQPDYTPTPAELLALQRHRLISPASPRSNGGINGNYSYSAMSKRIRSGGGGGQSIAMGSQPRYNTDDNMPAFSNGGGFRGLVNWRI